jgi:hypothetical protein
MNILFFISHQPNPRFIKQINFLARKHTVSLVHFQRHTLANLNDSLEENVVCHNLGDIPNASQPIKRIWTYVKAVKKVRSIVSKGSYKITLVNNIDVVLVYLLAKFSFFIK